MSEIVAQTDTRAVDHAPAPKPLIHQIWPSAVVGFGLGITAVWAILLGLGLVKLVMLAI